MYQSVFFSFLIFMSSVECVSHPYLSYNVSRTTLSGIAEYRSALTLDWLAAEDSRQRELALAFETESAAPLRVVASECISYPKPSSGKVARLMLELLKNLEGDDGIIIPELIQSLMRAKLLVETSMLDAEPSLESLVKTPDVMKGEPHSTFPRILAMIWMASTDPLAVKKNGWCPIERVSKYLITTNPAHIASHMRNIDPVIARARFIMEDFIQHVTPNAYDKKSQQLVTTPSNIKQNLAPRTGFNNLRPHPKLLRTTYSNRARASVTWASLNHTATFRTTKSTQHEHILVINPTFHDRPKKAASVSKILLHLLYCEFAVIVLLTF